jgi:hypothetical protein
MATIKISALPAAGGLTGAEEVPAVQSGGTVRTTAQDIADLAGAPALPVSIPNGGSGETTRQAALDAYFGAVTKGMSWWGDGTNITGLAVGADGEVLTADSGEVLGVKWDTPPVAGISIGDAIGGGTAGRILFEGAGPVLADNGNLTWGAAGTNLHVTSVSGAAAITAEDGANNAQVARAGVGSRFHDGSGTDAQLATPTTGGVFSDGPRTVSLCDGTNNVSYTPGTPGNWLATAPTDLWVAVDRLSAWIAANFPIPPPP